MVSPRLKVFWFSKDNLTGHIERQKRMGQTEEEGESILMTGMDFASSARASEGTMWKGIVANSPVVH